MCKHIVKVWCTESCWLFAHIWVVYKSRFHFLTVFLFSLTCRYPAVIWPWWVLEKYVPGYSSAWLWMCQISNVIIVFQCWSASTRDSIQMEHRCGSRCTSFFWNSLSILSGLLADTENPIFVSDYWRLTSAPSVLFWVSELAHFPSMLVQSFSTHFDQSPLVVLLFGSHALGLAICQRWGACPGSRCVDRPLFHVHLTQWGAIFKVCVFAIEFMLLYILKLPPIFSKMERWRYCACAGYNGLRDQHIVHLQNC